MNCFNPEKTRDAGFPAFFVPSSRPRGADQAECSDATEGQEGGTGKMRFVEIRDCVQAKGLRAASSGLCPLGLIRGGISHVSTPNKNPNYIWTHFSQNPGKIFKTYLSYL